MQWSCVLPINFGTTPCHHILTVLFATAPRVFVSVVLLLLLLPPQMGRDVFNEKPSTEELLAAEGAGAASALPRGALLHTTKVKGLGAWLRGW